MKKVTFAVAVALGFLLAVVLVRPEQATGQAGNSQTGNNLATHHREVLYDLEIGQIQTLALPKLDHPVRVEVSVSNLVVRRFDGSIEHLAPQMFTFLTVYDPASTFWSSSGAFSSNFVGVGQYQFFVRPVGETTPVFEVGSSIEGDTSDLEIISTPHMTVHLWF